MAEYDAADVKWEAVSKLKLKALLTEDGQVFDWSDEEGWVFNEAKSLKLESGGG